MADPDLANSPGMALNMVPLVERFRDVATAQVLGNLLASNPIAAGGAGVYCCGSSAALLGRLAVVRGRLDEAVSHFEEARWPSTPAPARGRPS